MSIAEIITTDEARQGFYPTPPNVVEKLLEGIEWYKIENVLEPSAGKGNLVDGIAAAWRKECYRHREQLPVDCIEIDPYLRSILQYEYGGQHESEMRKRIRDLEENREYDYTLHRYVCRKATDAAEITRLKKELKTVRAVMRSYILQIDSLNQLNTKLANENRKVKERYKEASKTITTLSEEKEALTQQVELASQLDAQGINMYPAKKNGKRVDKIKKAKKFVIDFIIAKNITAPTGEKTIYVRITAPDGTVLTKDPSALFKYENRELDYSIKKYIEYAGEDLPITLYWDIEEFLQPGRYRVHIFADGNMIGYNDFNIE